MGVRVAENQLVLADAKVRDKALRIRITIDLEQLGNPRLYSNVVCPSCVVVTRSRHTSGCSPAMPVGVAATLNSYVPGSARSRAGGT